MNYIKLIDDNNMVYPYTVNQFYADNPYTSFPSDIVPLLAEYNVFPVHLEAYPLGYDPATMNVVEGAPILVEGVWKQVWVVSEASDEEKAARLDQWRLQLIVSPFQGKAALYNAGLLTSVEALIADPQTDALTRLAWNNATEWKRLSPMIVSLAAALNLTDAQVDDLFEAAQAITA